mgnify:CR=1 FL=1
MQNELSIELVAKLNQTIEKVEKLADKLEEGANVTDKFSKAGKKLSKAFNFATAYHTAKKLFDLFMNGIDYINDYAENLNLFNVVLDDSISKATKFQNIMAESFGNNVTEQLKYQSLFEAMTESMGLTEEYAYLISENIEFYKSKDGETYFNKIGLFEFDFKEGFELIEQDIVVLTKKELMGYRSFSNRYISRYKKAEILNSYEDLLPGDYVVHEENGIGQFVKIDTIKYG